MAPDSLKDRVLAHIWNERALHESMHHHATVHICQQVLILVIAEKYIAIS